MKQIRECGKLKEWIGWGKHTDQVGSQEGKPERMLVCMFACTGLTEAVCKKLPSDSGLMATG